MEPYETVSQYLERLYRVALTQEAVEGYLPLEGIGKRIIMVNEGKRIVDLTIKKVKRMDTETFLKKWLPSNRALNEECDEEFIHDVEVLCETESESGEETGEEHARDTVRDWYGR